MDRRKIKGNHNNSRAEFVSREIKLNSMKEELYSLNMRLRLATQNHNEVEQKALKDQIAKLQKDIDCMGSGSGFRHKHYSK